MNRRPSRSCSNPGTPLRAFLACLLSAAGFTGQVTAQDLDGAFRIPAEFAGKLGTYRSPLLFRDGTLVGTKEDWPKRRREIVEDWTRLMGPWPEVLENPRLETLSEAKRENFTQRRVRLEIAPGQTGEGWLLIPDQPGRKPAALVVYYEPETSVGQNPKQSLRDFGLQLTRRGFVTLSIGTPGGDAWKPEVGQATCQPLSFHAYVAANAWQALAKLPDVDPARIGVTGHSYGGKWALFAAALWEKFAAVAVSDPGVVFDETRPNVNYWEPWYLGLDAARTRKPGLPTKDNPATGAYAKMREEGRDLHEIHALLAPRPFLVSGGSEDPPERWLALNHRVAVDRMLGHSQRVAMTNRPEHAPTEESNAALYAFFERFLGRPAPFTLGQSGGRWSLLRPGGESFFPLGVCVATRGTPKAEDDPENPSYAAWRHYPNDGAWAEETIGRLKRWGFNTIGGWSDLQTLRASPKMDLPFTAVLHLGSTCGFPWLDMWDDKHLARMNALARDRITPLRDDPNLIGYFTDNELGWWCATLWKTTLEHPPTSGQRRRLMAMLRERFANDWAKLTEVFQSTTANSWDELEQSGMLYPKPGGEGVRVMRKFLAQMAERYYQITRDAIRRHDQRALILGDRYQSFFYPEVAAAASRFVDVVSTNLNAQWHDGAFTRFYLDTLHSLTNKPIWVSEFYLAAKENRSGNRNDHGIFPVALDQAQRAAAARTTLRTLAGMPQVIAADWFQYYDEPRHGRDDGENFNFGLVDVHDRPYEELTETFAASPLAEWREQPAKRADVAHGVPPAPANPMADLLPGQAIGQWDRERGFVPSGTKDPVADLYVSWSPRALYLAVDSLDMVEDAYYPGKAVPKADRALWVIQPNGQTPIRARIGAGREALVSDPEVRVEGTSGVNLRVRNLAVAEIPAKKLGKESLAAGDLLKLEVSLDTHGRAYRVEWRAELRLAE